MSAAHAKINLSLVVGSLREDGKHEVATVLHRIDLADELTVEPGPAGELSVTGFPEDTLVRAALVALAEEADTGVGWRVRIEKRIPVAAGLGGGSSDAALALRLANESLPDPLPEDRLATVAGRIGADVPFFLADGPQLGTGDGTVLAALDLPRDYSVLLAVPGGEEKASTASVYRRFDERDGAQGFEGRRAALLEALARTEKARDLAFLPKNDLVSSSVAGELEREGAFRADVSGAGPAVYALFHRREDAERAAARLGDGARTWVASPVA